MGEDLEDSALAPSWLARVASSIIWHYYHTTTLIYKKIIKNKELIVLWVHIFFANNIKNILSMDILRTRGKLLNMWRRPR